MAVKVSANVAEGLEAVRESGKINMFDYPMVQVLAKRMGYDETVVWLMSHKKEYAQLIFEGIEIDD